MFFYYIYINISYTKCYCEYVTGTFTANLTDTLKKKIINVECVPWNTCDADNRFVGFGLVGLHTACHSVWAKKERPDTVKV